MASKRARFAGLLALAGLLVFLLFPEQHPEPEGNPAGATSVASEGETGDPLAKEDPLAPAPKKQPSSLPPHPESGFLGTDRLSPLAQARLVADILDIYRESMGAYPTAEDNPGVVRQLLGANATRRPYLSPDCPAIDPGGALLDAEGQPYHFHFISSQQLELRSAGADGQLYTADDLLIPSRP